jgi:hypothetical protein
VTSHLVALAAALLLSVVSSASAEELDAGAIADGLRLFRQKGNCQACHGWAGDGRKMDSQMADGSNLRESEMNRELLIITIKCGRPGTGMPAFDKFAYSDGRCFGLKQADLRSRGLTLADPTAPLQPREVELLADFMLARIVGKGPIDRAKCIEYWGADVDACSEYPK